MSTVITPKAGEMYFTKSDITVFNYETGKDVNVSVTPVAVLLTSDGEEIFGGTVYRCYIVTSVESGAAVPNQDTDLGNGWILHKWLGCPVALSQLDLDRKIGEVDPKFCIEADDYFYSEHRMTRYGDVERELLNNSGSVSAMADTLMEKAEWEADSSDN